MFGHSLLWMFASFFRPLAKKEAFLSFRPLVAANRSSIRIPASSYRWCSSSVIGITSGTGILVGFPHWSNAQNVKNASRISFVSPLNGCSAIIFKSISMLDVQDLVITAVQIRLSPLRPGARNRTASIETVTQLFPLCRSATTSAVLSIKERITPPNTVPSEFKSFGNIL